MRWNRVATRVFVVLAFVASRGLAAGFVLTTKISGMVGVVSDSSGKAARIVGVNAPSMQHHPMLSVRCADVRDEEKANCDHERNGWKSNPDRPGEIGFDLSKGYDLSLHAGGSELVGELETTGLLSEHTIELAVFDSEAASPNPSLVKRGAAAGLVRLVFFRASLRDGFLEIGELDERREWALVRGGAELGRRETVAATLLWRVPVFDTSVTVELRPFAGGAVRKIVLAPSGADRGVRIGLYNEPTKDEFCRHEPKPGELFHHFSDYFRLAAKPTSVKEFLPKYLGNQTLCISKARPPIICMTTLFSTVAQEW